LEQDLLGFDETSVDVEVKGASVVGDGHSDFFVNGHVESGSDHSVVASFSEDDFPSGR